MDDALPLRLWYLRSEGALCLEEEGRSHVRNFGGKEAGEVYEGFRAVGAEGGLGVVCILLPVRLLVVLDGAGDSLWVDGGGGVGGDSEIVAEAALEREEVGVGDFEEGEERGDDTGRGGEGRERGEGGEKEGKSVNGCRMRRER